MGKLKYLKDLPYDNYKVLNPAGDLICICELKKADWYLKRRLATSVGLRTIQLNFSPAGVGHRGSKLELYYLSEKYNHCVVCGSKSQLSKHHIIPRMYKRHFPERFKSHNSYDVVVLCLSCHESYEKGAHLVKEAVALQYGVVPYQPVVMDIAAQNAVRSAKTLLCHGHSIPPVRFSELLFCCIKYLGVNDISSIDLEKLAAMRPEVIGPDIGKQVMEKVNDLVGFACFWRINFINTMKPRYLPLGWLEGINLLICY